jgi:hypothetical protein
LGKSLLLISGRPEDRNFAVEVALTSGLSLQSVTDFKEAAEIIAGDGASVIFADASTEAQYQDLENAIQETVGLFSDRVNSNQFHFLSSSELERVPYLIKSPIFGHFIHRNYGDPKEAGQHYGRLVRTTQMDKAFGLANLLSPQARIQVVKLQQSTQKQDAVEAIRNYLLAARFQNRMATVIASAVDELIMNAIFDAPVDAMGKQLLASTPRSTKIELEGPNAVELHLGYDGKYVALQAVDHYGSLDKQKLMNHISKIYTEDEYKVRSETAGAGIGLATVFRSGGSFFFVSESRVRTEVTVFFKRTDTFREFKDQFRFISSQFYF